MGSQKNQSQSGGHGVESDDGTYDDHQSYQNPQIPQSQTGVRGEKNDDGTYDGRQNHQKASYQIQAFLSLLYYLFYIVYYV
jgi:hypothetical protein